VVAEDETGVRDVLGQVLHSSDRARAQALADIVLTRQRDTRTDLVPSLAARITDTLIGATKAAWERVGAWTTGSAAQAPVVDQSRPDPGLTL
jgi:hypothetical protein